MKIFETSFPKDYRQEEIKKILDFATAGKFCQLVCIPGAGKATILRLLAHNRDLLRFHLGQKEKPIRFIYLNLLELPNYDDAQIAKFLILALDQNPGGQNDSLILTKQLNETVNKLANTGQILIFLFDHFDEYQNRLPRSFFQMLRNFRSLAKYKFTSVFATRRELGELVDREILKDFYDFFTQNTIYLSIYDQKASAFMLSQIEKILAKKLSPEQRKSIIAQTSGHAKLTKVTTELVLGENLPLTKEILLSKPIIRATLFELWLALTAQEQQELKLIAQNQKPQENEALSNLIKFDLIKHSLTDSPTHRFTIPLFADFVRQIIPTLAPQQITYNGKTREIKKGENIISDLLSPQEHRLLKFLIENEGRIVERDEIITAVWPEAKSQEGISDEAIDQMVFRLRKKVENEPNNPKHVITVKGRGLRFVP